jgi:hypothetical protein
MHHLPKRDRPRSRRGCAGVAQGAIGHDLRDEPLDGFESIIASSPRRVSGLAPNCHTSPAVASPLAFTRRRVANAADGQSSKRPSRARVQNSTEHDRSAMLGRRQRRRVRVA